MVKQHKKPLAVGFGNSFGTHFFSCTRCINCARKLHGVVLSVTFFIFSESIKGVPNTNKKYLNINQFED